MLWPSAWIAAAVWAAFLAGVSSLVLWLAVAVRNHPWDTRVIPADALRVITALAFAWWVDPSIGILATIGAYRWLERAWWAVDQSDGIPRGWTRLAGGLLWPTAAMGMVLGHALSPQALQIVLYGLLFAGFLQATLGINQWLAYQNKLKSILLVLDKQVHGSVGQRTGLGIFLALLSPLALIFPSPWGWLLAGWFGIGIVLTKSAVASVAAMAGLLWVVPSAWIWILPVACIGFVVRAVKFSRQSFWEDVPRKDRRLFYAKLRHVGDSLEARKRVWRMTVERGLEWPAWLVGHGPGAFREHGSRWTALLQRRMADLYKECHNDYLEFWYEHGLVGLVAVAWFVWRYRDGWSLGDPLTGGFVALGMSMMANFPLKVAPIVAVVWLLVIVLVGR